MLPAMFRALPILLLAVAACGKKPAGNAEPATTPSGEEKINVPGATAETKGAPAGDGSAVAAADTAPDPRFFLKPEEGTLTVDKGEGKAGAEATAAVKVAPATGYHVATDYPIKLTLETADGVKLAKTEFSAGGRNKEQGDAQALSEQGLAFAVKATAEKAGAYEIKGMLKFGICEKDSCHPKKQPITITVAAN